MLSRQNWTNSEWSKADLKVDCPNKTLLYKKINKIKFKNKQTKKGWLSILKSLTDSVTRYVTVSQSELK